MSPAASKTCNEPIAIVGVGCRFPGKANSPTKLWEMLLEKHDALRKVSSRFSPTGFYHPNGEKYGSINVKHAYLIDEDVRRWDAQFFGINPKEAEAIDPQHRVLLETVYEAMENGGFTIESMRSSDTSVYVGVMTADYYEMLLRSPEAMPTYFATGTAASILSNRVSYFFDWKGPSETINTACSSSLVAIHRAVQSLRSGESRVSVAGGANLILNPEFMACESNLHMLSAEGRSRMWDHKANGYARGEAFAAVMLKKLSDAIADGDEIQGIIRETGVNSDGRTQGITLPSGEAQSRLIRQVYANAGLDYLSPSGRPQYFEAHGTGTPAGDPIEANGIRGAFFNEELGQASMTQESKLLVGSIKTAIGHTEGTAGLAGLIKTMKAIQNGVIPGNLLFEKLNPKVIPYTDCLELASQTRPWPALPPNTPRRASVNSFGFGGTNAHAILEEYKPSTAVARRPVPRPSTAPMAIPLVLSANSEKSLASLLENYIDLIRKDKSLCLNDLAWTTQSKRSELALKATFSGPTRKELLSRMEAALAKTKEAKPQAIGLRRDQRSGAKPRILGVFTGQGAQWANMGREILMASTMAKKSVEIMDAALAALPDAPTWTIAEVLLTEGRAIDQAEFSQPICTAVQVMVIDILHSMGIEFSAVVGHSSGEMAAAYAAGCLSATDAIVIAFYRGLHTKLARGPTGKEGSMMAAGLSFDEAEDFCSLPQFKDRVWIAASNAPASVTLSGDVDAIKEAKADLDSKGIFARALVVNKAYHSAHMIPVSRPYMDSLDKLNIQATYPRDSCTWISSVYGDRIQEVVDASALSSTYWKDNMLRPVLFSTAVEQTLQNEEAFDFALEVGPHTALKGPFLQTVKATIGSSLPYCGTIMRKVNGLTALADTMSFFMNHMSPSDLKTAQYIRSVQGGISPKFVTGLPNYPWDMSNIHWAESRYSRKYRQRERPRHEILGSRLPDDLEYDMRWQNTLRLSEVTWLSGHVVQGQVVYPGAGYLVMAMEAAQELVKFAPTKMIELLDIELSKAITLDESSQGVDTLLGVKKTVERTTNGETFVEADFSCFSAVGHDAENWDLNVKGRIRVTLANDCKESLLPVRTQPPIILTKINVDSFYEELAGLGFCYTGLFRRLDTIERRMGYAVSTAKEYPDEEEMPVAMHPALMDAFFQSTFAALHFPEDGEMTAPYLPTSIKALRISTQQGARAEGESTLIIDTNVTEKSAAKITADIDVYNSATGVPRFQVQGLSCTSLERPAKENDIELYTETIWKTDVASLVPKASTVDQKQTTATMSAQTLAERLALVYLRQLDAAVSKNQRKSLTWTHQRVFDFVDSLLPLVASGQHPSLRKEWMEDTAVELQAEAAKYSDDLELRLVKIVGEYLLPFVKGEVNLLECMMKGDLLNQYYASTQATQESSVSMSRMVEDIAHRYAGMKILEISGGSTHTTKAILETVGHVYKSYTFTDVTDSSFDAAQKSLMPRDIGVKFQTLDITGDVIEQGFEEESFDLIVLSAPGQVSRRVFQSARKLIRPGGFILLHQTSPVECLRTKFISLGLPGWWADESSRTRTGQVASDAELTTWLQETGFSGIDRQVTDTASQTLQTTVVLSQAMTDEVAFFRNTLSPPSMPVSVRDICIVGKDQTRISEITKSISSACARMGTAAPAFAVAENIEDVPQIASSTPAVIFLQDLDQPIWKNLTEATLSGFKHLLESAKHLLWVVSGSRVDDAYAAASVGLARVLWSEYAHVKTQILDVEPQDLAQSGQSIAAAALRLFVEDDVRALCPKLLWTQEPELLLQKGTLLIPRIKSDRALNQRLNAERRPIYEEVDPTNRTVLVCEAADGYVLTQPPPTVISEPVTSDIVIQVEYSMLHTIKAGDKFLYLNLGRVKEPGVHPVGTQVLALSNVHASIIKVNQNMVVATYVSTDQPEKFIQTVSTIFVASTLFTQLSKGSKILMFAPEQTLSQFFEGTARAFGMDPLLITTMKGTPPSRVTGLDNLYVNPNTTERNLRAILPSRVAMILNFTNKQNPASLESLNDVLDSDCLHVNVHELFAKAPATSLTDMPAHIYEGLLKSQFVAASLIKCTDFPSILTLGDIVAKSTLKGHPCVLDFTKDRKIPVQIAPVKASSLFRSDKTYFLVGCTGGLGQALCRWMVLSGAKHLALTTRNPKSVNQTWRDELARLGGDVRFFACDVTDAQSLHKTYEAICKTMPPVIGVANAAMLLADKPFFDQTLEHFQSVLKPKVDGTIQLDRLFSDTQLDFFILFSSLANTVGNRGQANYSAANGFMQTVAAQRRKKGLTGSVMNIGMVLGIGVVSQEGLFESQMKRQKWMPVSEPAFINMFCQAILIGKPDSGHSQEMTTGLARMSARQGAENPWYAANLRFSHHILADAGDDSAGSGDALPLRQQLAKATNNDGRSELIQRAFCVKLGRVLGAASESIERAVPLLALGIDSLMAMDVRSWFLAELEVDVPVLKILGGGSVQTLCDEAATKLPASIISAAVLETTELAPLAPAEGVKKVTPTPTPRPTPPVTESFVSSTAASSRGRISSKVSSTASRISTEDASIMTPSSTAASSKTSDSFVMVNKALQKYVAENSATDEYKRVTRMSFSQERLWFLQSYLTNPATYNISLAYRVKGKLRVEDFEQAFYQTIERHETLRTAFFSNTETFQSMLGAIRKTPFVMQRIPMKNESQIMEEFVKTKNHHYDLEHGETMKATLLIESPISHVLIMGFHHIAVDATSSQLLVRDFSSFYAGAKLGPLKYQYMDWAAKQRATVDASLAQDISYWKTEFPDFPDTLPLFEFASTKSRRPLTEYNNRIIETRLDASLTTNLKVASQKLRVTPFHLHLATLQSLLYKLLNVKDACIGITDANKNDPEHMDTLGFFVNLLPLRLRTSGAQSFASLAQKARDKTLAALSHSQLPFNVIMDELNVPRSNTANPLFQVLMNYKMGSLLKVPFGECEAEVCAFQDASNPYDLQFDVEAAIDGTTLVTLTSQNYLYSESDLKTVLNVYAHLLKSLAAKPALALQDHSTFSKQDIQAAIELGKGPRINVSERLTISGMFDQAVKRGGNDVAVVDNIGGSLTWPETAAWVNTFAAHLQRIGIEPGAFVGVYCEPSVKSVCYWLAVLRIGAVYVPLDVSNPVSRLELIVDDCKPAAIICDESTWSAAQRFGSRDRHIVQLSNMPSRQSYRIDDLSTAHSTACVIYTSGTTGTPKGTMLTNANFVNHIVGVSKQYNTDREVILQATNLGFDLSLGQMMQFLASAGKLVVASIQSRTDPAELVHLMAEHKVTYTILTPSVYALLLRQGGEEIKRCTSWRLAFSCGEALTSTLVKDFQQVNLPQLKLINSCGPTEITVINTAWEIPLKDANASELNMFVGKSLPNYSTYILGDDLRPVPVGFAGEMVVGGASISQGYLHREELSATKWVADPFATAEEQAKGWSRMYRTGDRAKLLPDGNMQFLGRIAGDQQVKLRGVRIELGDVASTLVRHANGDLVEASVVLRGEGDSAFLAAFVTFPSGSVPRNADAQVKKMMTGLPLPASMIPSRIAVLPTLPRTPNGKIDNRALIAMDLPDLVNDEEMIEEIVEDEPGSTVTEKKLKTIWSECLKQGLAASSMRKTTDFFQAGGNSMLLVNVQAKIRATFGCTIRLYTLFQSNTIEAMAIQIDQAAGIQTQTVPSQIPTVKTSASVKSVTPVVATQPANDMIDWKIETRIERDMLESTQTARPTSPVARNKLEVILTGATGFLGRAILEELVQNARVAKIHCIAIRLPSGQSSRKLTVDSSKIEKYYGDLSAPNLGLSDEAFAILSARADRIIHNGAEVSFLKSYQSLVAANVTSTKSLAKLAVARKIPIHFVSTAGVASFYAEEELPETFIPDCLPPTNGMGGYAASKWAAETYLQKCYSQCKLPVRIHRPSNILGEGAEEVNMTANIIEYSLRTGSAPRCSYLKGSMQFVEVDEVASGIVHSLFAGVQGAHVNHHCGDEVISIGELREYLESRYNRTLRSVELDDWLEASRQMGLSDSFAALMGEVLRNEGGMAVFKTLGKGA